MALLEHTDIDTTPQYSMIEPVIQITPRMGDNVDYILAVNDDLPMEFQGVQIMQN